MNITRINQKNQINIPKEIAEKINFGPERYVQVVADSSNVIYIIPISPEPVYSRKALEGLDRLVEKERDKAVEIKSVDDIKKIFKKLP